MAADYRPCRYTKALEVIKKLHKDQAQEIKVYKLKLENLQTLKDAAHKVKHPGLSFLNLLLRRSIDCKNTQVFGNDKSAL